MPLLEVKIPPMGESINSGVLAKCHVKNGDVVKKDQPLFELETGKAGRVTKGDMISAAEGGAVGDGLGAMGDRPESAKLASTSSSVPSPIAHRPSPASPALSRQTRKKMSPLRAKIAQRLVAAQH